MRDVLDMGDGPKLISKTFLWPESTRLVRTKKDLGFSAAMKTPVPINGVIMVHAQLGELRTR